MDKNIVRIEDVTNIVGIKNYIDSLSLNSSNLIYDGYDLLDGLISLKFNYEGNSIKVLMDKDRNIKGLNCDCADYDVDYCKHIGLVMIYIMQHREQIDEIFFEMNNSYDYDFNYKLFSTLNAVIKDKILLNLEITFKNVSTNKYELRIKIGDKKSYVLKNHIRNFLDAYYRGKGEVEFGNSFIYNPQIHYFNDVDQKIINFIGVYMAYQESERNYYGYYANNNIILSNNSLKEFLKLLDNKKFTIEKDYNNYEVNGIEKNYEYPISLEKGDNSIILCSPQDKIVPFIEDYSYVLINDKMVYFQPDLSSLIRIIHEGKKNKIIFKESDYSNFANLLLPKLDKLNSNLKLEENFSDIFNTTKASPKYYFEKNKHEIIGTIKLDFNNTEIDIFDSSNNFNGIYLIRDKKQEQDYIDILLKIGFKIYDHKFILEKEEDIINFIDYELRNIVSQYEVYVSKNLKNVSVIKKIEMTNTFSIGKDNILNYSFELHNIDKKEISKIINAMKEKKKYYRLKNGNYVDVSNSEELDNLCNLIDTLDIDLKSLSNGNIELPKYKSMHLIDKNFIKIDDNIQKLINDFNKYKDLEVSFDDDEKNILRDYQRIGVKWMLTISKCGFGGILADEMGLGKSIQTITYIKMKLKDKKGKFLIIAPTSLIYNWENEFNKFARGIKYLVVNDSKLKRMELLEQIDNYDVVITTYGLLRHDIDLYSKYEFDTCIVDEAQNIKNINAETTKAVKKINALTKFALTGTPIENSVMELFSIFDYIMPGYLSSITNFKKKYNVNMDENKDSFLTLNEIISPFIMRRKKKNVLKDLPDKIENNVIIELDDSQKKLYVAELEKTKKEFDDTIQKEGFLKSQILILSLLTKLRQICISPKLVIDDYCGGNGKFESLIDILKQVILNEHKVLLFSQFPSALKLLFPLLKENNITYYYLDGSTKSKDRINLVNKFNNDDTNVFLISLKAGGTGLNLTSADVVIHLDPWWNPQVENQATDRAHRIGQKKVVEVIKLIAKGTIEEKIIDLQNKKKELSGKVIEGNNRDQIILSKLTEEDIKRLLY